MKHNERRRSTAWDHEGEEMRQRKLLELRELILSKQKEAGPSEEQ